MQAVIYKRVSARHQILNTSLETQEEICRNYAETRGYNVISIYEDRGVSAKSLNGRDSLRQLLEDAKSKSFDVVLVYKVNRLSRNTRDALTILDRLSRYGVSIASATEGFDVSSASGRFMFTILAAQAQMENEIKAEQISVAYKKKAEREGIAFRYILGYRYENGKAYVVEDEAKIVKDIYTTFAKYKNYSEVARLMNKKGYKGKRGRPFSANSVKIILDNPAYAGSENIPPLIKNRERH